MKAFFTATAVLVLASSAWAAEECEETSLLATGRASGIRSATAGCENAFLASVAEQMQLPEWLYTVSGTHFAQGYTNTSTQKIQIKGMAEDCENINLNYKLSDAFRSDVFGSEMKGFFWKCERISGVNKYWFTISSESKADVEKLCDSNLVLPVVYDEQHQTYWQDLPFACDSFTPPRPFSEAFLTSVSEQMRLPRMLHTVSGTHFAQGYTNKTTEKINVEGMREDCENINLNYKLSDAFRSDVFGSEMKGFFYKCEKVGDKNKYWFTIGSESRSDIKKLCDPSTTYPIVYDAQHDTYWQDFPFTCDS